MENQSSDRLLTVFVAALGLFLVGWGWQRANNPATVEINQDHVREVEARKAAAKAKGKGGGAIPLE